MTDQELLAKYLETKNTDPEQIKVLLEHAERIFARESD
jgi:hypothetical protein